MTERATRYSSAKFIQPSKILDSLSVTTITAKLARQLVVPRLASSKKGDNGIILVIGGSRLYHGAPVLTSIAALRSGADLVYTGVPRSIITAVRAFSPSIIAIPLADEKLTIGSANRLMATMPKKADAAAIGMGMSIAKREALITLVKLLKAAGTKILLDASALIPEILDEISGTNTVVTPHFGEYKRLFGKGPGSALDDRVLNVKTVAKEYRITVLLKGAIDIVSDGEQTGLNKTHNCAMTVGGTGDVLSGVAVCLIAKMRPFEASILASYFNGLAGNLAYKRIGLHMMPTDLVDNLPTAMKKFDRINSRG